MHTFPTAPGRRSLRTIGISPGRRGADDHIRCRKRACDRAPQMLLVLVRWARCRRRLNTHPRVPVGNAPLGQPACWVVRVGVEPGLFGVALVRGRLVVGVERSAEIRRMHVPMRLKSGSGEGRRPARAVGLLSINLTLLAELALLLRIDSDERRREREVGIAVDERVPVDAPLSAGEPSGDTASCALPCDEGRLARRSGGAQPDRARRCGRGGSGRWP